MKKLLFLTGMPGSGKSTTGKLLAQKLGFDFIDLDHAIESSNGKSIKAIFDEEGEDAFRMAERNALLHIIENTKNNAVISLGGGTVAFFDNVDIIRKAGKLIYLEVTPDVLFNRLRNQTHNRPLFNATDPELKIKLLLDLREKFYRQADFIIDANANPEAVAEKIAAFFNMI